MQRNLAVHATRSGLWTTLAQVVQLVVGLASFWLLSFWLAPGDYGLFGMAATFLAFVGVLGDSGITAAIVRHPEVPDDVLATGFWISMGGATALTLLCAVGAPFLAWFYGEPSVLAMSLALAVTFLLAAPGRVSTAMLQRTMQFKTLAVINMASLLLSLVGALVAASMGLGAWALIIQMGLGFMFPALFAVIAHPVPWSPRLFRRHHAKELGRFGSHIGGWSLATTLGRAMEGVLAGRLLGAEATGYLNMGFRLITAPLERFSSALSNVFLPTFTGLQEVETRKRAFIRAVTIITLLVAPICLGTAAISDEIVTLLPARWSGLAPVLRVQSLGLMLCGLFYVCVAVLTADGRSAALFKFGLVLVPMSWTGSTVGALMGSAETLAAGWSVAALCGALCLLGIVWRSLGMDARIGKALVPPIASAAIMALCVWAVLVTTGLRATRLGLVVGVVVGVASYSAVGMLVMREQMMMLVELLKKAVGRSRPAPVVEERPTRAAA